MRFLARCAGRILAAVESLPELPRVALQRQVRLLLAAALRGIVSQRIEVLETYRFGKVLVLDGCVMLSERDEFIYHEMISHVPLGAHPRPANVLIIGGGDGGTLRDWLSRQPRTWREILAVFLRAGRGLAWANAAGSRGPPRA